RLARAARAPLTIAPQVGAIFHRVVAVVKGKDGSGGFWRPRKADREATPLPVRVVNSGSKTRSRRSAGMPAPPCHPSPPARHVDRRSTPPHHHAEAISGC